MTDQPPDAPPAKGAIQSTTFQGLALIVLVNIIDQLLTHYKIQMPGLDTQIANDILSGIGILIAGYGRITATHKITGFIKAK